METVWISHPHLGDRKVEVPKESLYQHQRAGWEETEPPPLPPLPEPDQTTEDETSEAPVTAGASSLPKTESPKGRRTKGDEQ